MDILQRLMQLHDDTTRALVVAIDGGSGAGKTSLAHYVARELDHVTIISTNDFLMPLAQQQNDVGAELDWRRLKDQVLIPLAKSKPIKYWRYDPTEPTTQQWVDVVPNGIVVIEGAYSTRLELAPYYDVKMWVEAPMRIRLERMVQKDGDNTRDYWSAYLPNEVAYMETYLPQQYADIVIDGTASKYM